MTIYESPGVVKFGDLVSIPHRGINIKIVIKVRNLSAK